MPRLGAPLPDFLRGVENAIHRARGAEIRLFLEQRGLHFGGRLIDEPLAVQHVEHRLAFGGPERARRGRAWGRRRRPGGLSTALLHESSPARTMPTDRILTCRCDTTLVGRGRSSDSEWRSRDVDDERREPHRNLGVDKAERLQDLGARGQAGAGHRRHPWRCAWLLGAGWRVRPRRRDRGPVDRRWA